MASLLKKETQKTIIEEGLLFYFKKKEVEVDFS